MLLFKDLSNSETLSFRVFIFLLSASSKIVNENQLLPHGHLELTCTTRYPRTCIFFETKSLTCIWPSLNLPPCFAQYFGDQFCFGGYPGGSDGKESTCSAGDAGSIPGSERAPREGNGTLSTILASTIPWSEEPGGLQSMGSYRIGQDWSDLAAAAAVINRAANRWRCRPVQFNCAVTFLLFVRY